MGTVPLCTCILELSRKSLGQDRRCVTKAGPRISVPSPVGKHTGKNDLKRDPGSYSVLSSNELWGKGAHSHSQRPSLSMAMVGGYSSTGPKGQSPTDNLSSTLPVSKPPGTPLVGPFCHVCLLRCPSHSIKGRDIGRHLFEPLPTLGPQGLICATERTALPFTLYLWQNRGEPGNGKTYPGWNTPGLSYSVKARETAKFPRPLERSARAQALGTGQSSGVERAEGESGQDCMQRAFWEAAFSLGVMRTSAGLGVGE